MGFSGWSLLVEGLRDSRLNPRFRAAAIQRSRRRLYSARIQQRHRLRATASGCYKTPDLLQQPRTTAPPRVRIEVLSASADVALPTSRCTPYRKGGTSAARSQRTHPELRPHVSKVSDSLGVLRQRDELAQEGASRGRIEPVVRIVRDAPLVV